MKQVNEYLRDGRFALAEEICLEMLKKSNLLPDEEVEILEILGLSCVKQKKWKSGLEALLTVLKINNTVKAEIYEGLAEAFENSAKSLYAAQCYLSAARRKRTDAKRLVEKANALLKKEATPEERVMASVFLRETETVNNNRNSTVMRRIQHKNEEIENLLYIPRKTREGLSRFHILRGHSSFTPILRGRGGGYFITHGGRGCVVDPGYGFIKNFVEARYGFGDIHAIVVTHAHDDHVADLPAICSILHKAKLGQNINLYLDATSYEAFGSHYMLAGTGIKTSASPIVPGCQVEIFPDEKWSLTMDIYKTKHEVPVKGVNTPQHAVGLGFKFGFPGEKYQYVLYSSDTGWDKDIECQYVKLKNKIDAALLHISSIKPCEWNRLLPDAKEEDFLYSQHLGLLGVTRFVDTVRPKKVLLGEHGAELDGVWEELAEIIADACGYDRNDVSATEIGTMIKLDGKKVEII